MWFICGQVDRTHKIGHGTEEEAEFILLFSSRADGGIASNVIPKACLLYFPVKESLFLKIVFDFVLTHSISKVGAASLMARLRAREVLIPEGIFKHCSQTQQRLILGSLVRENR